MKSPAGLPSEQEMKARQKFIEKVVRFCDEVVLEQEQVEREGKAEEGSHPSPFRSDAQVENLSGFTIYRRRDMMKGNGIILWHHPTSTKPQSGQQVLSSTWFNIENCYVYVFQESIVWRKEFGVLMKQGVQKLFAHISTTEKEKATRENNKEKIRKNREEKARVQKNKKDNRIYARLALESNARRLGFKV